jgi:hypothetical protein
VITLWMLVFTMLRSDGSREFVPGGMPFASREACMDSGVQTLLYYTANPDIAGHGEIILSFACGPVEVQP